MEAAAKIPFIIGLLASGIVCGAWWFAALHKKRVAIFFWLAAAHSITFGLHLLSMIYIFSHTDVGRIVSTGSLQTLMAAVLAVLYVILVRWLVRQQP